MHRCSSIVSTILLFSLLSVLCATDPLHNPALNPVEVLTPETHEAIPFIRNGELLFEIAVSPEVKGPEREAIQFFKDAVWRATGRVPENAVMGKPKRKGACVVYFGDCGEARKAGLDAKKLPRGGFYIHTSKNKLFITGRDRFEPGEAAEQDRKAGLRLTGTLNGVSDFTERFFGVRIYLPGKFGSIRPKITDLTLTPMSYRDYPRIQNVNQTYFLFTGFDDTAAWSRIFETPDPGQALPCGPKLRAISENTRMSVAYRFRLQVPYRAKHAPDPKMFADAIPEEKRKEYFFTTKEGKTYYGGTSLNSYYDITNERLAEELVRQYKKYLDGEPSAYGDDSDLVPSTLYMPFGQCDMDVKYKDLGENDTVKRLNLLSTDNRTSEVHARFVILLANELKKVCPESRLSVMAYAHYENPPKMPEYSKFPDNVDLQLCPGDLPIRIRNEKARKKWAEKYAKWKEVLGGRDTVGLWLYNASGNPFARAVVPALTGETIRFFWKDHCGLEVFFDYCGSMEWCYYYAHYVMYRSMWNPDFDIQAALDEHWNLFYGPDAGPLLKEFHQLLTDSYHKYISTSGDQNALYPPEVLDKFEKLLNAAEKALGGVPPAQSAAPQAEKLRDDDLFQEDFTPAEAPPPPEAVEKKRFRVFAKPWRAAIANQRKRHAKQAEKNEQNKETEQKERKP